MHMMKSSEHPDFYSFALLISSQRNTREEKHSQPIPLLLPPLLSLDLLAKAAR